MTHPHASTRSLAVRERVAIVGLALRGASREAAERSLDELAGLVHAAGGSVVCRALQERPRPDAATFLGSGKTATLKAACDELEADLVAFDNELAPAQLRNLERLLDRRVIDRTQLILDIFAKRAHTREGKLQVERAQLEYLLPRLVGFGLMLSRLGGGIGTKGPGETKLETDRRRIRQRIAALSKQLDVVRRRRGQLRERRQRQDVPTVALVGYTNAGKTTLFNQLAREHRPASDALFVTLDPLVRRARLPGDQAVLVSDTVGFIDRLPHTLVEAFHATLEEVGEAELLLHVVDASSDDRERHMKAVRAVLDEIGAGSVPMLVVFNKCDRVDGSEADRLERLYPGSVAVSALLGEGLDRLAGEMAARLGLETRRVTLEFDVGSERERARLARAMRLGHVVGRRDTDGRVRIELDLPRRMLAEFLPSSSHAS